ncbi:hypothetical protein BJV82DRAFT_673704 [Fennellomyces sp. T-0311]|nr:hypothetical protein BJV82DRAFT_673704 [Fennellomyces sp. T-0311]
MKVLSLATIFALVATVALAHNSGGGYGGCGGRCGGGGYGGSRYSHEDGSNVIVGGSNNEGKVGGILNNAAKGGVLASNDKNAKTTVITGHDH